MQRKIKLRQSNIQEWFAYCVCQSIMKPGQGTCKTPRLNVRRFEELVVGKIRSNVEMTDAAARMREDRGP